MRRQHLSKDREVRGVLVRMSRDTCSRQKTALVCLRNMEACAHEQSQPGGESRISNEVQEGLGLGRGQGQISKDLMAL